MPYADVEKRRAYNCEWWKRHPEKAVQGKLPRDVEAIVWAFGPVSPSIIVEKLGYSTPNAVGTTLHRLRVVGRVRNCGYGKWVAT